MKSWRRTIDPAGNHSFCQNPHQRHSKRCWHAHRQPRSTRRKRRASRVLPNAHFASSVRAACMLGGLVAPHHTRSVPAGSPVESEQFSGSFRWIPSITGSICRIGKAEIRAATDPKPYHSYGTPHSAFCCLSPSEFGRTASKATFHVANIRSHAGKLRGTAPIADPRQSLRDRIDLIVVSTDCRRDRGYRQGWCEIRSTGRTTLYAVYGSRAAHPTHQPRD